MNSTLPPELIEEILLRLPLKSIVRLRLVSKQFLSLTKNPLFTKSYFDHGRVPPINDILYTVRNLWGARWVDIDESIQCNHIVQHLPLPCHRKKVMVMGSCRGFLLLQCELHLLGWSTLILWNPLTGVYKKLPYHYHSPLHKVSSWYYGSWYGLGYDESRDDYLVVMGGSPKMGTSWEFFSVRNNSWKEITSNVPHIVTYNNQPGVFLNGAIHWLADIYDDLLLRVIIVFDLANYSISEIQLPNLDLNPLYDIFYFIEVFGGCLVATLVKDGKTEIWVMKEYRVHSSWSMCYSFSREFRPIYLTKCGEVVAIEEERRLVKLNDKGIVVERQPWYHHHHYSKIDDEFMFTPSLLSFPCVEEEPKGMFESFRDDGKEWTLMELNGREWYGVE